MTFGRSDDELATMPLTFRNGLFDGQVALVSGSGRGIGKAIAFQLARLGAKVALCGRDAARLDATAEKLRALGADVLAHPMSIRDPDAVARLHDAVWEKFGTLDLLVNNAGGQFPQAAIRHERAPEPCGGEDFRAALRPGARCGYCFSLFRCLCESGS